MKSWFLCKFERLYDWIRGKRYVTMAQLWEEIKDEEENMERMQAYYDGLPEEITDC